MSFHTLKNPTSGKATFSFYNDDDTGIDSEGANQIDLMTGGTVRAKVTSSGLSVDTINEYTSNTGVTIDSVLRKDGGVSLTGALAQSSGSYRTPQVYKASIVSSIAGSTTAGAVFGFVNPASSASTSVMILKVNVNLGTACSSAAGTIDIGTASASNASGDNLIDGLAYCYNLLYLKNYTLKAKPFARLWTPCKPVIGKMFLGLHNPVNIQR